MPPEPLHPAKDALHCLPMGSVCFLHRQQHSA